MPDTAAADTLPPATRHRLIAAALIGGAFEWFDLFIYGSFIPLFAEQYFVSGSEAVRWLTAVATFGIAYLFRPIGGILFGIYADRIGRKAVMVLMMAMMALGTGIIGVLPNYAAIGVLAPTLLVLSRIIQGISAAGEYGSAVSLLLEYAPPHQRARYSSLQFCSQLIGIGLPALFLIVLNSTLTREEINTWGWRIPFLFGILLGPVGVYIRSRIAESPAFLAWRKTHPQPPHATHLLKQTVRDHGYGIGVVIGINAMLTAWFYVPFTFIPAYAVKTLGFAQSLTGWGTFCGALLALVGAVWSARLSDRIGAKPIMLGTTLILMLIFPPLFTHLQQDRSAEWLLAVQIISSALLGIAAAPSALAMARCFPVPVRATGISIGYNIAVPLFGGLSAFWISLWQDLVPTASASAVYYVLSCSVIGIALYLGLDAVQQKSTQPQIQAPHTSHSL